MALQKIEGVDTVDVDFNTKTATVTMKPGLMLTDDMCTKAFEGTKYKATSITRVTPQPHQP